MVLVDKELLIIKVFAFDNQLDSSLRTLFYALNQVKQLDPDVM